MENCQQSGLVKMEDTVEIRAVYPWFGIQLLKKKKETNPNLPISDR